MKHLLIIVLLSLLSASLYAGNGHDREIENFLDTCRQELNTPFVKSPSYAEYYTVGKTNGVYILDIDIQLRYPSHFSTDEFVQASQLFEDVKEWIKQYYKNYGLYLDIHFEHAHFNRALSNPHPTPQEKSFVVYVRRHTGSHMKELFWGVNQDWDINERAKVIAHELSHLLLLKDEYLSATGAQTHEEEASYENDSLMKNADHPNPKLYLRHFQKILSPLCQPRNTILAQDSVSNHNYSH